MTQSTTETGRSAEERQEGVSLSMRECREHLGLSLRALEVECAKQGAPVSNSQLSKIERGLCRPRPAVRAALRRILGQDPAGAGGES